MKLKVIAALAGVGLVGLWGSAMAVAAPAAATDYQTMSRNLTTIEDPPWKERESVQRRFEFLLQEFDTYCPKKPDAASIGDQLAFSYRKLKEIGLDREETILDLFNQNHRMIADIFTIANAERDVSTPGCTQFFAMYISLRKRGESPDNARRGIVALYKGLMMVGAETDNKKAQDSFASPPVQRSTSQHEIPVCGKSMAKNNFASRFCPSPWVGIWSQDFVGKYRRVWRCTERNTQYGTFMTGKGCGSAWLPNEYTILK